MLGLRSKVVLLRNTGHRPMKSPTGASAAAVFTSTIRALSTVSVRVFRQPGAYLRLFAG
jgi:hypothetical protein